MKRIAFKSLLVTGFAVIGVLANNQTASALGNNGYFSGAWTCASSPGNPRDCGNPTAYYENDVVPGRSDSNPAPAVPNFGNNKAAYRDWVIGQYNSPDANRHHAARFIIATMLGGPTMADNINEFRTRIDNPALTMTLTPMTQAQVNAIGPISYRGLNDPAAGGHLDFFWEPFRPGSAGNVYEFFVGGSRVYALQQNCGNPVGLPSIPGMPEYDPENWSLSAGAKVKPSADTTPFSAIPNGGTINGSVGQSYTWELWLRNNGPTGMTSGASYVGVRTGFADPNWNNNFALARYPSVTNQSATVGAAGDYIYGSWFSPGPAQQFESYTITVADVGRTVCQHMAAYPRSTSSNTWLDSAPACVYVPYDYDLTPTITVGADSVETDSTVIPMQTRVNHSGTPSRDTQWRVIKVVYDVSHPNPDGTMATVGTNTAPCAYFAGSIDCNDTFWQSTPNPIVFTGTTDNVVSNVTLGADYDMNKRVCYATAVSTPTQDSNPTWAYSALECVLAAKRPKVQFWGADVRSGGRVHTNMTNTGGGDPKLFGSWAEYGLLSSDSVVSSSGGGLASGNGGLPDVLTPGDYNRLTFANTPSFGNFGTIKQTELAPILLSNTGAQAASNGSVSSLLVGSNSVSRRSAPGNLEISGGSVPIGRTIIVKSGGTVRITGNISYESGPYDSASKVPQMVIVANNIIIDPGVTEVNAWLIATSGGGTGYVSTCGSVALPAWLNFNVNECAQKLVINGPVVTDRLFLRRTFGSETASLNEPAEIFSLRPDTYLWAYNMARSTGSIKTGYTRELPPRF